MSSKRKRSCAWKYFEIDVADESIAKCLICDKTLSHSGTTSNLFKVCSKLYTAY